MTITSTTAAWSFVAAAASGDFQIPARVLATADLAVYALDQADGTVYTPTYTIELDTDFNGATAHVTAGLTAGDTVVVRRVATGLQPTAMPDGGRFPSSSTERALDRLTTFILALNLDFVRALRVDPSDDPLDALPIAAERLGKFLSFDAVTGAPVVSAGLADVSVSAAMEAVVGAATLALARAAMGSADAAGFTLKGSAAGAGSGAPANLTQAQALAGLLSFVEPGHRLSLTTAVAVTVADVLTAGTIYWTPRKHSIAPIYNGTAWVNAAIAEKSLALDSDSGHTGYHQSGKNFCVWLDYNAGTPRIGTGPAWSSDVARAAAGEIVRDATYGYIVNNASMTFRFGTGAGDTATKTAGTLLYLGTFRASANGQTEDSLAKRFVWNMFNRVPRAMRVSEATDSWSYNTATIRQANGAAGNQLDFVRGLDEDAVCAQALARWANDNVGQAGYALIGLDSTTVMATGCLAVTMTQHVVSQVCHSQASWRGVPGLGRRTLTWLEAGSGVGTHTWSGDGGSPTTVQCGISGEVMA